MTKILLGYARRSVIEADRATHSPERQRANIDAWAAAHGYQVEYFEDLGISGKRAAAVFKRGAVALRGRKGFKR